MKIRNSDTDSTFRVRIVPTLLVMIPLLISLTCFVRAQTYDEAAYQAYQAYLASDYEKAAVFPDESRRAEAHGQ